MTLAEENYLKSIFNLETEHKNDINTNSIAEYMDTQPSSVTDMVQKLAVKDVLTYKKYKGVQLTESGRKMAAQIVRKHRLWECFLFEKLHFQWDEVHDVAEQLEHIKSDKLVDRLDAFLGFPKFDPHGDPIPDKDGIIDTHEQKILSDIKANEVVICVGVKESGSDFLKYLDKKNINIGTIIKVQSIEFDGSMELRISENTVTISPIVAENLFVQSRVNNDENTF